MLLELLFGWRTPGIHGERMALDFSGGIDNLITMKSISPLPWKNGCYVPVGPEMKKMRDLSSEELVSGNIYAGCKTVNGIFIPSGYYFLTDYGCALLRDCYREIKRKTKKKVREGARKAILDREELINQIAEEFRRQGQDGLGRALKPQFL
jgi:hypothetical protein